MADPGAGVEALDIAEAFLTAEHPRALNRNRLGVGPLTRLSAEEMDTLDQALRAALGLSAR